VSAASCSSDGSVPRLASIVFGVIVFLTPRARPGDNRGDSRLHGVLSIILHGATANPLITALRRSVGMAANGALRKSCSRSLASGLPDTVEEVGSCSGGWLINPVRGIGVV